MLIQNTTSIAQAPQQAMPVSESQPNPAANSAPPSVQTQPVAQVALPQVAVKQAAEQQPSAEQLKSAVDNINKALQQSNSRNLEFSVDDTTHRPLVKLVDKDTGDVIRQYPTKEAIAISQSIEEFQKMVLLTQEA